jgi:nitrate reductase assembly molybdenum cofactor insertion protein NarJ
MKQIRQTYPSFAQLFSYPNIDFVQPTAELCSELKFYGADVVDDFQTVAEHFTTNDIASLQEYYISTFDVNASCYLDIGYVLFGEESKRGQFLLNMNSEQRKANNDCGKEFADHLPNMLTLLPKIKDCTFREELVVTMMLPALRHMYDNFRNNDNIYQILINLLIRVLETDYMDSEFKPYKINQREIECSGVYSCGMDFTKLSGKKY